MKIQVRAKAGRVAYTAPKGGKLIPADDTGIRVERDAWINRLLEVHKDIEIVPEKKATSKASSADTATEKA